MTKNKTTKISFTDITGGNLNRGDKAYPRFSALGLSTPARIPGLVDALGKANSLRALDLPLGYHAVGSVLIVDIGEMLNHPDTKAKLTAAGISVNKASIGAAVDQYMSTQKTSWAKAGEVRNKAEGNEGRTSPDYLGPRVRKTEDGRSVIVVAKRSAFKKGGIVDKALVSFSDTGVTAKSEVELAA